MTTRTGTRSTAAGAASAGAALAMLAVCALALNLRTAAVSLSPLVSWIEAEIPLPTSALGLLGMMPPIVFAFAGLVLGRWIAPRGAGLGVLALGVVAAGSLLRAFATDLTLMAAGGAVALLGMGVGNVLAPVLVRRYLPRRIGLVTALYTALLGASAMLPPLIEPGVAQASSSWRVAMGLWAVLPLVCAVPMALLAMRDRAAARAAAPVRGAGGVAAADSAPPAAAPSPNARRAAPRAPWRPGRTAALLALVFSVSATIGYTSFAWMPVLVRDRFGVDETAASLLLSLFAALGIPVSLVVPRILGGLGARASGLVATACAGLAAIGYVMLAVGMPPEWAVVSVTLIGLGQGLLSMCLTLAGLLGRTPEETGRLSAFMQGLGYAAGAVFTLVLGYAFAWFGTWLPAGVMMAALSIAAVAAGVLLSRSLARDGRAER